MRPMLSTITVVLLAACTSSSMKSSSAPRASRDHITRAQIEQMPVQNAYELVQRLRPEYLREQRGVSSLRVTTPLLAVVYVDGVRRGRPESLRELRPTEIEEIRFMNGTDATTRYGTDHGGGVIDVKTRRDL
jgi:outer membrane cobalamin receptor